MKDQEVWSYCGGPTRARERNPGLPKVQGTWYQLGEHVSSSASLAALSRMPRGGLLMTGYLMAHFRSLT